MNTTHLLITLMLALVAIAFAILATRSRYNSGWALGATVGGVLTGFAFIGCFVASFTNALGAPIVATTKAFSTEVTPYRVIIKAFDREVTFTDVYTVAMVKEGKVEAVRLTIQRNAWGMTHEAPSSVAPKLTLVLKGEGAAVEAAR